MDRVYHWKVKLRVKIASSLVAEKTSFYLMRYRFYMQRVTKLPVTVFMPLKEVIQSIEVARKLTFWCFQSVLLKVEHIKFSSEVLRTIGLRIGTIGINEIKERDCIAEFICPIRRFILFSWSTEGERDCLKAHTECQDCYLDHNLYCLYQNCGISSSIILLINLQMPQLGVCL